VSEDHLSVHVTSKAIGNSIKISATHSVGRCGVEIQSKPEEGLEMGGRLMSCAKVVVG